MTENEESRLLIAELIRTLVKLDSYPYATGFLGSILTSLLSGEKTPEQGIEFIKTFIKENGGNNG